MNDDLYKKYVTDASKISSVALRAMQLGVKSEDILESIKKLVNAQLSSEIDEEIENINKQKEAE